MIDLSLNPSRPLRIFACIARWALGVVLAFWLVIAAVWGTLHGFIVPRIGEWRAEVEHIASQALGMPVQIEAISARSSGFFPTVHLTGVSLLDEQGRQALRLNSVMAVVSARSLLRRGLEQLYVERPELDIRHLADGRWQVAGLDVVQSDSTESRALDWLLEQPELVIEKGHVSFTDEQRLLDTQRWRDVDVVVRNRLLSHILRMDATPESGGHERMQVVGAFSQSLLPSSKAPWARWSGQWYAALNLQEVPQFPWPHEWGVQTLRGQGLVRAWVDVQRGQTVGVTADMALPNFQIDWSDPQVSNLALIQLKGRLEAYRQGAHWSLQGKNFTFQAADGSIWPSSNWQVSADGDWASPRSTHLALDYADLGIASHLAQSLPIPAQVRNGLARWAPQGELRQFQADWTSAGKYVGRGQVKQLLLQPQPSESDVGIPGFEGLDATVEFSNQGGKAALSMADGVLYFPGVFEEPNIPVQTLQAQINWGVEDGRLKVTVPEAQFVNPDAQGSLHASWRMGESDADRLPGYLQLQGVLKQANGARVYRYLPLEVPEIARHYVRDSVKQGQGRDVEFEVAGNLLDMPFDRPGTGRFYIKAPVHDVEYEFVPTSLQNRNLPRWPSLKDLQGTLVFDGVSMQVLDAETGFAGHPALRMGPVKANIPDLEYPHLTLHAQGKTELQAALGLVKQSPLAAWTDRALDEAQAQGPVHIAFDLDLPVDHLEHTKVQGRVGFDRNGLKFSAQTPWLQQLQGALQFHDQGFELLNVQGQSLGGNFKIQGGMPSLEQGMRLQAEGTATAAGLQKDGSVPVLDRIAEYVDGKTSYTVDVTARQGVQKVLVSSDLRGMGINLPVPLDKQVDDGLGLRVEQTLNAQREQTLHIDVAGRGWVRYVQDMAASPPRVVSGQIVIGEKAPEKLNGQGVAAYIYQPMVDLDAWRVILAGSGADVLPDAVANSMWMPQRIGIDVEHLKLFDRDIEGVRAELTHTRDAWRGRLKAKQFAGNVEYRMPTSTDPAGRVFARLTHLSIPKSDALDTGPVVSTEETQKAHSLPALDIEVDRLDIAGKALGKLELKAYNTQGRYGRDWTLEQFYLTVPEARWRANGYWGAEAPGAPRTTHLSFLLEMDSAGQLLDRFGMKGVIREGQGRLSGNLAWQGSVIDPQWNSMDGSLHMAVGKGQFLKVEPGIGKLLSVLSLQSLTRRMSLDFRDVFSQGFAFDVIRGDVNVHRGIAKTNNLQMNGLNAAVLMEGQANLVDETQDLQVVVVPEINAMTASLAATVINPVIGVGSFVAQMLLRGPLMEAATRVFHIQGTWADPKVLPVSNKVLIPSVEPTGAQP